MPLHVRRMWDPWFRMARLSPSGWRRRWPVFARRAPPWPATDFPAERLGTTPTAQIRWSDKGGDFLDLHDTACRRSITRRAALGKRRCCRNAGAMGAWLASRPMHLGLAPGAGIDPGMCAGRTVVPGAISQVVGGTSQPWRSIAAGCRLIHRAPTTWPLARKGTTTKALCCVIRRSPYSVQPRLAAGSGSGCAMWHRAPRPAGRLLGSGQERRAGAPMTRA